MPTRHSPRTITFLILIGLVAGFMSGLFGVGGGIIIVPALVILAGFEQRLAAGTSLAAILPTAIVGVVTYAIQGHVDVVVALILAAGAVVGAQIGSWLLSRLPKAVLQWGFIAFLLVVVVQLFLVVPSRDQGIELSVGLIVGLVALGLITGVLSGLLGIGGGVVVVPMLILLFGSSDLIAKGSSLLMMIPTALSGTIGNARRKNVDLLAASVVGVAACTTTTVGALVAGALAPEVANVLFAVFLVLIAARMISDMVRARRRARREASEA
ncbi:hypothetical protein CLV49_0586 [Labedella gwakjiensis]|uniref:Probable membrane transporter protein n=1 Tax=Labedella gwakjiensis TaxID=390269 RepID=A0A2P8GSP0_9MICO|nr:sulfite exporter TauE/SafE family protein [Labedella gwakjiensis]PSL36983.1 hypothetical protein CLV49_0586 [Labedella gwakjiensis]